MMQALDVDIAVVLGAGTMGSGIAQVLAQAGIETRLFDLSDELVREGFHNVEKMLNKAVAKERITSEFASETIQNLVPCSSIEEAFDGVSLVIEAVPEQEGLKKSLLKSTSKYLSADILYASNTSSLSISQLAKYSPYPESYIGMHFFNPPPVMKLLEVVCGNATSPEAVSLACNLGKRLGKHPIVVKDSPGFASSRLGLVLGLEAMRMLEEGVASAEDIDTAMTLGYRHPMGPLKLTDLIGLDVRLDIAKHLAEKLDERRFGPPDILKDKVRRGELGQKSGKGFYSWD